MFLGLYLAILYHYTVNNVIGNCLFRDVLQEKYKREMENLSRQKM